MGLFSRRAPAAPVPIPAPMAPTTREICARIGMPVPVALQDKDA
jgi:hypothetical protein